MDKNYTWDDMPLCKECYYADKNPNLCNSKVIGEQKPDKMIFPDDCSRFLRKSKAERMNDNN